MTRAFGNVSSLLCFLATLLAFEHGAPRPTLSASVRAGQSRVVRQDSVVRGLVIKGARLVLDSSLTLDSVQRVLGKTTLVAPQHHDDNWSICYSARDSIGPFTVRLLSNELGGPGHELLGFDLSRRGTSAPDARNCASLGVVHGVKTDNGLYLGMPVAGLLAIMGRPARANRERYSFDFHVRLTDSVGGQARTYDLIATLDVKAAQGRVVSLSAWHGEYM